MCRRYIILLSLLALHLTACQDEQVWAFQK